MSCAVCAKCEGTGWIYPPGSENSGVVRCRRCRGTGKLPRRWTPPRDPKRLAAKDEE